MLDQLSRRRLLWVFYVCMAGASSLIGGSQGPVLASSGTELVVSGTTQATIGAEGETTVSVRLAPQDTLGEFEVSVAYDPAILEVEDADAIVLNPRWDPPTGLPLLVDASVPGLVTVHSTTGDPCPAGSVCGLFSFSWRALANGVSPMSIVAFVLTGSESGQSGVLSGVTTESSVVQVGTAATATPTHTAAATPTLTPTVSAPTPTATATAPVTATTPTVPATQAPPGPITSPSPSSSPGGTSTVAGATAQAPSSGNGLAGGAGAELAQGAMAAFVVAALLAFGWIMSTLRRPDYAPAVAGADGQRPRRTREEIEMDLIADYLRTMEALGMASSDIDLEERRGTRNGEN